MRYAQGALARFASVVLYDFVHYMHACISKLPPCQPCHYSWIPFRFYVLGCDRSEKQANRSVLLHSFIIAHAATADSGPLKRKQDIKFNRVRSSERPASKKISMKLQRCSFG